VESAGFCAEEGMSGVQWLVICTVAVIVALWLFFRLAASGLVLDAVLIGALLVWQLGERKDA